MPSISVIIPTYNGTAFIRETLHSVFQQTRQPDEIIVVDDASTDGTPELVESIGRTAPIELHLVRCPKNHAGPPAPLNIGIARARGELIATLDHDDLMLPRKLDLQGRLFEKCPDLGLIICQVKCQESDTFRNSVIANTRAVLMELPRQPVGDECFRVPAVAAYNAVVTDCYPLTCSSFLFSKAVWRECGGFDEKLLSMADFGFLQAVTRRHDLGIVMAELLQWTGQPSSLFMASRRKDLSRQYLHVYKSFDANVLTPESKGLLRRRVLEQFLWVAHMSREQGDYLGALSSYLISIYYGRPSWKGFRGVAVLVPHLLLRVARRATKNLRYGLRSIGKECNSIRMVSADRAADEAPCDKTAAP